MCFPFLTITSLVIHSELCLHGRHCGKGMFTICLFTFHNYHLHMKKLKSHVNQISSSLQPVLHHAWQWKRKSKHRKLQHYKKLHKYARREFKIQETFLKKSICICFKEQYKSECVCVLPQNSVVRRNDFFLQFIFLASWSLEMHYYIAKLVV